MGLMHVGKGHGWFRNNWKTTEQSRNLSQMKNGKEHYKIYGIRFEVLPQQQNERFASAFLLWHNENRLLA